MRRPANESRTRRAGSEQEGLRRSVSPATVHAVDAEQKLYETAGRELWQSPVITADGLPFGRVVRQIIEPSLYTVRYLVVLTPQGHHVLLPSTSVVDITEEGVICNLDVTELDRLPAFRQTISRVDEEAIYQLIGQTPHWVEEADVLH